MSVSRNVTAPVGRSAERQACSRSTNAPAEPGLPAASGSRARRRIRPRCLAMSGSTPAQIGASEAAAGRDPVSSCMAVAANPATSAATSLAVAASELVPASISSTAPDALIMTCSGLTSPCTTGSCCRCR